VVLGASVPAAVTTTEPSTSHLQPPETVTDQAADWPALAEERRTVRIRASRDRPAGRAGHGDRSTRHRPAMSRPDPIRRPDPNRRPRPKRPARPKPRTRLRPGAIRRDTPVHMGGTGSLATAIRFALAHVGDRYRARAAGPDAYDCSGLVMAAFARIGVVLPHSSGEIIGYGRPVARGELRPGDLVWPRPGHVVIYLGGGRIVEAANPRAGVRVAPLWGFWTARRLL
jgi:cell wall-associated NlpC family hydrolase